MNREDDILKISKAVIDFSMERELSGNSFSSFDGYVCIFCCGEKVRDSECFKHDLECPVLIAQDLLT